jgi:hypothetical protein
MDLMETMPAIASTKIAASTKMEVIPDSFTSNPMPFFSVFFVSFIKILLFIGFVLKGGDCKIGRVLQPPFTNNAKQSQYLYTHKVGIVHQEVKKFRTDEKHYSPERRRAILCRLKWLFSGGIRWEKLKKMSHFSAIKRHCMKAVEILPLITE